MDYSKVRESVYSGYSLSTRATFVDFTGARGSASKVTRSFGWQVGAALGPRLAFA